MTESGQAPETPPNQPQPDVPDWAPAPTPTTPEPRAANPPPADETPPAAGPAAVDATMRLPTRAPGPHPAAQPGPAPPQGAPPAAPPASAPAQSPHAVDATMRLPVQHPPAPPATYPAAASGERRIGKYRVKGELGRGGMGAVYLAEQPGLGREVAIKELILSPAADPTALMRFLQEAQVMARPSRPNLVQ